jgi:hypothetical protein
VKSAESKKDKEEAKVKSAESDDPENENEEEKESFLKDLMSIGGHGGIFRFVSQGRNGIIVESLDSGKRMNAFSTMKVSALDDIAIFTDEEEVKLEEVFASIYKYENGGECISHKSDPDELKDYFSAILPNYDRERVYVSDIKKVLSWYNILHKHQLLVFEENPDKPS